MVIGKCDSNLNVIHLFHIATVNVVRKHGCIYTFSLCENYIANMKYYFRCEQQWVKLINCAK